MNKDPYLDDHGVLKNLLGITDEQELDRAEEDISYLKLLNIDSILPEKCDYEHMLAIHKHILGDIYEWAGRIRIIPIVKGERVLGGDTVRYSHPDNIERDAKIVIDEMNAVDWLSLSNRDKDIPYPMTGFASVFYFRQSGRIPVVIAFLGGDEFV